MRLGRSLFLTSALALACGSSAHADLLVNGGFELPSTNEFSIGVGNPDLVGWTIVAGNIDAINVSTWTPYAGSQSIDMDGTTPGTIQQSFATTIGARYNLEFAYANNPFGGATIPAFATVDVTGNSSLYTQSFSHSSSVDGTDMNWTLQDASFTADSTSTTLTFTSNDPGGSDGGIALDSVSVTPSDVPEPGSFALLAVVGLSTGGLLARRKRARGINIA